MKNKKWFVFMILCLFSFVPKIKAADLKVSANAYTVYIGSTVNVTARADGLIGRFTFKSSNNSVLSGSSIEWLENSSKTISFKAMSVGTVNISVIPDADQVAYSDGSGFYTATKTVTINVINRPVVVTTSKSSVNYLKSLQIDGKEITPKFDKQVGEYSIELEAGTTTVNIKATAEHNKASIIGAGNRVVTEGNNNLDVIVTAENGSKRTYTIKASVKEKDPIVVKIDNQEYTVIRKKKQLPSISSFYTETTVKINDEDIPAYFGEVTKYTLVGLKGSNGSIDLFIYDEKNNSYQLYRELEFSRMTFYPTEALENQIPKYYSKSTVVINDLELPCYKMNKDDVFVLLYGVNIENNNKGFYMYDPFENTLQRYNDKIFDGVNEKNKILTNLVVGLLGIVIIILFTSAIQGSIKPKTQEPKEIKKFKTKEEKMKEKLDKIEAKKLKKELKKKEKPKKKKKNKLFLEDTHTIDINEINIKK